MKILVAVALAVAGTAGAPPAPVSLEPLLVTSVDTSAGGTGARLLMGDVTGDGRLDIVTMQPTYSADDRFIGRQVQALTAFDVGGGGPLWQVGTPDPRVTNNGTDIPAEIYDLDGDGMGGDSTNAYRSDGTPALAEPGRGRGAAGGARRLPARPARPGGRWTRPEFTGLGRYVRLVVDRCAGPARLAAGSVLGTR